MKFANGGHARRGRERAGLLAAVVVLAACCVIGYALVESDTVDDSDAVMDSRFITSTKLTTNEVRGGVALVVPAGYTVTLNLNGHYMQATGTAAMLEVYGTLIIKDTAGGGYIQGGYPEGGGAIYIADGGKVTLNNVEIRGGTTSSGAAIEVSEGGTLVMNGGTISGGTSGSGGCVYVAGTFTMNYGTITGGVSNQGGGVFVEIGGKFTMNGGTVTGSKSNYNGGGVFVQQGGNMVMYGGSLSGNTSDYYGGNLFVRGSFVMYGGTITGGYAGESGGGMAVIGDMLGSGVVATAEIRAGTISDNTASDLGGGVYVGVTYSGTIMDNHEQGRLIMTGGTITGNTADYGGAIYTSDNESMTKDVMNVTLSNVTISGNTARSDGGAIYGSGYSLTGVTITGNTARSDGAGIHGSLLYLKDVTITGNSAGSYGGGIHTDSYCQLDSVTITGNSAKEGAGVYVAGGGVYLNDGTVVSGNRSTGNGAGVYLNGSKSDVVVNGAEISGNAAQGSGGALYVNRGALRVMSGTITGNTAGSEGGAVYIEFAFSANVYITGGTITGNVAGSARTSGVYLATGGKILYISGSPVIYNNGPSGDANYGLHLSYDNYPHVNGYLENAIIAVTTEKEVAEGSSPTVFQCDSGLYNSSASLAFFSPYADMSVGIGDGNYGILSRSPGAYPVYYHFNNGTGTVLAHNIVSGGTLVDWDVTYPGHRFAGWSTGSDGSGVVSGAYSDLGQRSRLDLYAVWQVSHTLTLDPNGGEGIAYTVEGWNDPIELTNPGDFRREGYDLLGWSADRYAATPEYGVGESVTLGPGEFTLYAVWGKQTVTVTWQDTDGTVLLQESVAYGSTPSYSGEIPDHDTAETDSTLSGWTQAVTSTVLSWSPVVGEVTEDTVYTAVYTTDVQIHELTINVNDPAWGYASLTVDVPYGTIVSIVGYEITLTYGGESTTFIAEPEEPTEKYTYYLDCWIVDGVELDEMDGYKIEGDVEITAVFDVAGNSYVVSFDANGGTGTMPVQVMTYGEEAELDAVAFTNEGYAFAGWALSADGSPVYADSQSVEEVGEVTLYAVWARNTIAVSISAVDGIVDATQVNAPVGSVLSVEDNRVTVNGIVIAAVPAETGDVSTEYTFSHWELNGVQFEGTTALSADSEVVAVFEETVATVVVVWCDYDGTILLADTIDYGTTPEYTGEIPVRESTEYIAYTFSSWSQSTTNNGNIIMTAEYAEYTRMYTVTAGMDADDGYGVELLYDIEVPYGADIGVEGTFLVVDGEALVADLSAASGEYTYEFVGWSVEDGSKVTADMEIIAYYRATPVEYTVTWTNQDGTVLLEQQVAYGTVPEYTGETPVYADMMDYEMALVGWSPSVEAVDGDVEYTAMYSPVYTVEFVSDGGFGSMSSIAANIHDGATLPSCSYIRLGYSFAGWATEDGETVYQAGTTLGLDAAGGDTVTLHAVWEEDPSSYVALAGVIVGIIVVIGVAYALVRTYRS